MASKASDLDKILTNWRHTRKMIVEEDPKDMADGEMMRALLLEIMPQEYVKDLRE